MSYWEAILLENNLLRYYTSTRFLNVKANLLKWLYQLQGKTYEPVVIENALYTTINRWDLLTFTVKQAGTNNDAPLEAIQAMMYVPYPEKELYRLEEWKLKPSNTGYSYTRNLWTFLLNVWVRDGHNMHFLVHFLFYLWNFSLQTYVQQIVTHWMPFLMAAFQDCIHLFMFSSSSVIRFPANSLIEFMHTCFLLIRYIRSRYWSGKKEGKNWREHMWSCRTRHFSNTYFGAYICRSG